MITRSIVGARVQSSSQCQSTFRSCHFTTINSNLDYCRMTGQGAFIDDERLPLMERVKTRRVGWDFMQEVHCSEPAFDFVKRLLTFNPSQRMSLTEALGHSWLHPKYWPWRVPSHLLSSEEYAEYEQYQGYQGGRAMQA
jgi:serine/threonine protein kinase